MPKKPQKSLLLSRSYFLFKINTEVFANQKIMLKLKGRINFMPQNGPDNCSFSPRPIKNYDSSRSPAVLLQYFVTQSPPWREEKFVTWRNIQTTDLLNARIFHPSSHVIIYNDLNFVGFSLNFHLIIKIRRPTDKINQRKNRTKQVNFNMTQRSFKCSCHVFQFLHAEDPMLKNTFHSIHNEFLIIS